MKNILIIGAGRSSTSLIKYLLKSSESKGWLVTVADAQPALADEKVAGHQNGLSVWLDVNKPNDRKDLIKRSHIVISMLPAELHFKVARDCIQLRKHLITASYLDPQLSMMGDDVADRGLVFLTEMGLDPGIDHMSAAQQIEDIKSGGGRFTSFRSCAGGLVAPESDDNPWHYKITWNPGNVVGAGLGTAKYLKDGKQKYLPHHRLFQRAELIDIQGLGQYEMYANRDSLRYRADYGLEEIPNIVRGTLRYPGFCEAWDSLIRIGLTENNFPIRDSDKMTYHELVDAFIDEGPGSLATRVAAFLNVPAHSTLMEKLNWLGVFGNRRIRISNATPASILQDLLLDKWKMKEDDKDMVVMQHDLEYERDQQKEISISTLVYKGQDAGATAMSTLVGLPLGIAAELIMEKKISSPGVKIPVTREIYEPVLGALQSFGVDFKHTHKVLS